MQEQLIATTATALEIRWSRRRSLTRQKAPTAQRACHRRCTWISSKGFLKKRTPRHRENLRAPEASLQICKKSVSREASREIIAPVYCIDPARKSRNMSTAPQRESAARTFRARLSRRRRLLRLTRRANTLSATPRSNPGNTLIVRTP